MRVAVLGLVVQARDERRAREPGVPDHAELLDEGAIVKAYDPVAMHEAQKVFPDSTVRYCEALDAAVAEVDAVIVVTPWKEFA